MGQLQGNKIKQLTRDVPNLSCIETLCTKEHAQRLNECLGGDSAIKLPLRVFIQVNTSGEGQKSGIGVPNGTDTVLSLAEFIRDQCPNLLISGLMTIGSAEHYDGDNPDFSRLHSLRRQLADDLKVTEDSLELSMGMSADFEQAVNTLQIGR